MRPHRLLSFISEGKRLAQLHLRVTALASSVWALPLEVADRRTLLTVPGVLPSVRMRLALSAEMALLSLTVHCTAA